MRDLVQNWLGLISKVPSRSERIELYLKLTYTIAKFMYYVPVEYNISAGKPACIVPVTKHVPAYRIFGYFSSIIVTCLVFNFYIEAFFGEATRLEFLVLLAINSVFVMMVGCQWFLVLPSTRLNGMGVINSILNMRFYIEEDPPLSYELLCTLVSICGCLMFPILYFPLTTLAALYFPNIFRIVHSLIELVVLSVQLNNPQTAICVCQMVTYSIIAISLGQAVVSLGVIGHWVSESICTTSQYIESTAKLSPTR